MKWMPKIRFRLRTLILITFAVGFLAHLVECMRGQSAHKLSQLLLVFFFGASIVFMSPILVSAIVGRKLAFIGVIFGAATWSSLLFAISRYEGEIFRIVWLHIFLLVTTTLITLWASKHREEPESSAIHSVEKLMSNRAKRPQGK